jgi:hypothetical protein
MPFVELGIRAMLGVVFAIGVAGKLRSRAAFDGFVDSIPAFPGTRGNRLVVVAVSVVVLELAAMLLLIVRPQAGLVVATSLLTTFTAVMIVTLRAGTAMVCRCFGGEARPVGRGHVVRNAILVAASLAAAALRWRHSTDRPGPEAAMAAVMIGIGVILGVLVTRSDDLVFLFRPARSPLTAAGEVRRSRS